jgi:hypothetical protein
MRGCSGGRQEQMIPIFISIKDQPAMGAKDFVVSVASVAVATYLRRIMLVMQVLPRSSEMQLPGGKR